MEEPVPLAALASHLICKLCSGYLIEATTIIECLHTFCKSCIVKYLEEENTCPQCKILIHQSHPLSYIMADRTMQDIVFKVVPGLFAREKKRVEEFYNSRNLQTPDYEASTYKILPKLQNGNVPHDDEKLEKGANCNYHRNDIQVSILMQEGENMPPLKMRYLQCSIQTSIKTLRRYLSQKLYGTTDKHNSIDIFCQKELMGKEHTLEFVLCTRWRSKDLPLLLEYKPKVDVV